MATVRTTEQHSRNQNLGSKPYVRGVLRPGRPIENRPQAESLPYISLRAAKIFRSSSRIFSRAFGAAVLLAQVPAPSATTAGLIRLSVAALNSNGEPVLDLKADDFQVSDQGKPQRIVYFRGKANAEAPAQREYSNRADAPPHYTVILFDLLNENQSDRQNVSRQVGRSLQQLESSDRLYLYMLTLEGNLSPNHPIGGKSGDDSTWTQQIEKTIDKAMKTANHARPAQMNDKELVVKRTYVALETLANQLAPLPGRRDIVWITNGMPNVWNPKTPCNGDWVDCALYVP